MEDEHLLIPAPTSWFEPENSPDSNNRTTTFLQQEEPNHCTNEDEHDSSSSEEITTSKSTPQHFATQSVRSSSNLKTDNENDGGVSDSFHRTKSTIITESGTDTRTSKLGSDQTDNLQQTQENKGNSNPFPSASTSSSGAPAANMSTALVGAPYPSPSWKEISSQVLPSAARELLSSSLHRLCHTARLSYTLTTKWQSQYRELSNPLARGYFRESLKDSSNNNNTTTTLPPFSSLPWMERQMVKEWRTFHRASATERNETLHSIQQHEQQLHQRGVENDSHAASLDDSLVLSFESMSDDDHTTNASLTADQDLENAITPHHEDPDDEDDFARARTLVPTPMTRPTWQNSEMCHACYKPFGPTRLRHHCRQCGRSFCQAHSAGVHDLPHLAYQVPERVCDDCKIELAEHDLAERVAWRLARCRDFLNGQLCPYFELGVDTLHDMVVRVTNAAISMAKSIPLGAQATVAVETLEVLRKHGLNGIYTILLRQEFLSAANMLQKALGINQTSWPLSVHELSAAIFYALAQHRALRGLNPEHEHDIHAMRPFTTDCNHPFEAEPASNALLVTPNEESLTGISEPVTNFPESLRKSNTVDDDAIVPVCDVLPDSTLNALIFYAPLALHFIYANKEVDMQLLAAQQGWRLLYAYLHQERPQRESKVPDRPASAVFVHDKRRIACLAIRGTATIHDVVTDIRQLPVPFPEPEMRKASLDSDWTTVPDASGLAVSGMANAALNLYREHADSLLYMAQQGYEIRMCGHSLGGGVAVLLGALLHHDFPNIKKTLDSANNLASKQVFPVKTYGYGTPACIDAELSDKVENFAVTAVLHDDVVPRLSPSSCRGLLKHLLHIRDTWVKEHLPDDIMAITERASLAWAPRWRGGFTLLPSAPSSTVIKRYCRKQYQKGKRKFISMKKNLLEVADGQFGSSSIHGDEVSEADLERKAPKEEAGMISFRNETPDEIFHAMEDNEDSNADEPEVEPCLLVDYMGGIEVKQTKGVVIDGDEFFEAEAQRDLVEDEDAEELFEDAVEDLVRQQREERANAQSLGNAKSSDTFAADEETPEAVVLAETPLPRLYIPGRVAHIYSHRGCYRAVFVPRSFRELRRITMAGNMLSDHTCKAYYEALLEVRTVRRAMEDPPQWTAFDEDDTCSCCASKFTWASTSDSEAQEARDKHNCRSCGTLVCDPCSSNRIPLPTLGLTNPVRVCDRCYHDIDGIASSLVEEDLFSVNEGTETSARTVSEKPVRTRERRSFVVDELASRISKPDAV